MGDQLDLIVRGPRDALRRHLAGLEFLENAFPGVAMREDVLRGLELLEVEIVGVELGAVTGGAIFREEGLDGFFEGMVFRGGERDGAGEDGEETGHLVSSF